MQCAAILIIMTTVVSAVIKLPIESHSDPLAQKETKAKANFIQTERASVVLPNFSQFIKTDKRHQGTCEEKFEAPKQLDTSKTQNDKLRTKTSLWQKKIIGKLPSTLWFILFLTNLTFLVRFTFLLARSRSVQRYRFNLIKVHIFLSMACIQLLLLSTLQKEFELGGIRFTKSFIIKFLGVVSFSSISAATYALLRILY